jgi:1-acyl-sn-glycerol-3-phosphate acyltransferase
VALHTPAPNESASSGRSRLDALLTRLARLVARIFFSRIEIAGSRHLPPGGPLLIIANHGNSLVDPMLVLAFLPYASRFLAKSTLWRHPVAKHLVRWAGAIPVYRRQDPGSDTSNNVDTFKRSHEVLASGGVIALFPEGLSHGEPRLMPMKTGAARIALGAESERGPLGVRILPVGLNFEVRDRFRSRVLIQIGPLIDPEPEIQLHSEDGPEAVRLLTQRIGEALAHVTLNYDSWREARLVERAAEIYSRPEGDLPSRSDLSDHFPVRKAFVQGYEELRESHPDKVSRVVDATEQYDQLLRSLGLDDRHVASRYPLPLVARFIFRSALFLLWRLPLAVLGSLLNWLPYRIPGWVTGRLHQPAQDRATFKVLMSLAVFPLFWLGESLAVGWWLGPLPGMVVLLLAPVAGYFALRFGERWWRFREEAFSYLTLKTRRRATDEIRRRRRELSDEVAELVQLYQAEHPD